MDRPHQGSLKVLSLNVAHGRKDTLNQVFLKKSDFENNLAEIAKMLVASDADIVALLTALRTGVVSLIMSPLWPRGLTTLGLSVPAMPKAGFSIMEQHSFPAGLLKKC